MKITKKQLKEKMDNDKDFAQAMASEHADLVKVVENPLVDDDYEIHFITDEDMIKQLVSWGDEKKSNKDKGYAV